VLNFRFRRNATVSGTAIDLFAPTDTATTTPIATLAAQTPVVPEQAEVVEEKVEPIAEDVATLELDFPKTDTIADAKTQQC